MNTAGSVPLRLCRLATLDVAGVNLLAVQELEKRTAALQAENTRLLERLTELEVVVQSMVREASN